MRSMLLHLKMVLRLTRPLDETMIARNLLFIQQRQWQIAKVTSKVKSSRKFILLRSTRKPSMTPTASSWKNEKSPYDPVFAVSWPSVSDESTCPNPFRSKRLIHFSNASLPKHLSRRSTCPSSSHSKPLNHSTVSQVPIPSPSDQVPTQNPFIKRKEKKRKQTYRRVRALCRAFQCVDGSYEQSPTQGVPGAYLSEAS